MKLVPTTFDQMIPHLIIAAAAAGVFVILGVLVTLSILLENWHNSRKRKAAHLAQTNPQSKPAQAGSRPAFAMARV